MNQLIVAAVLWASSLGATALWFYGAGQDSEIATQAKIDATRVETRVLAAEAAASAIAGIKVEHRVIQGRVERVTIEKPVYRDCVHAPGVVLDINEALTGRKAEPAGGDKLPRPVTVGR